MNNQECRQFQRCRKADLEKKEWKEGDKCQCKKKGESIIVELVQIDGGKEGNPRWEAKEITSGRLLRLFEKRLRPLTIEKVKENNFEAPIETPVTTIEPTPTVQNVFHPSKVDEEEGSSEDEKPKRNRKTKEEREKMREERLAFKEKKFKLVKQFKQLSDQDREHVQMLIEALSKNNTPSFN